MDSHHSIHTLAAIADDGNGKQHPMHQFHHTLQHIQHNQPLISANNQNHQLLQFHHPIGTPTNHTIAANSLNNPYSTLHHPQHQQQPHHQLISQLQLLNNPGSQANSQFGNFHHQSSSQNSASSQATLPSQQHHHLFNTQALMGQSASSQSGSNQTSNANSQQAYNMNSSDYSSSTYHVYDQILGDQIIDDLIVIKQERMKKKLEQEHRRKVILFSLAVILLVGLLMFLVIQLFRATSSSTSPLGVLTSTGLTQQQQQMLRDNSVSHQLPNDLIQQQQQIGQGKVRTQWAPSAGGQAQSNWQFDPTNYSAQQPILRQQQTPIYTGDSSYNQLQQPNNRVIMSNDQQQQDPRPQQQLALCLVHNCNNNGQCNPSGRCQCYSGFVGNQCEFRVPVVANNPMIIQKPPVSHQPIDTIKSDNLCALLLNNCSGNGQCTPQGRCKCQPGFTGDSCQQPALCYEKNCSNQGSCQPETGLCHCKFGFKGNDCEQRDDENWQKLLNCSNHGKYDYVLKKCNCDQGYSGIDCSEEKCEPMFFNNNSEQASMDCGQNGLYDCQAKRCVCRDGYSGHRCQVQQCSAQCLRNGQCLNGTCVCQVGFYGKHCTFNGCPNKCSGRGQCVRSSQQTVDSNHQEWRCLCPQGSTGDDCGTLMERQCDDGIDNDRDGLIDCADSECCGDVVCQNSTLCLKSADPLDILMRKQPPPPTSSFFQRMQFLIEKLSSQIYSNSRDFNDSILASKHVNRASVIRGRVTYQKQGITGVRVSVAGQINLGIAATRDGGYFDLMVNGGGAVVVEFQREPFATLQRTIRVPWNEIVLMDPVELQLESSDSNQQITSSNPWSEPDTPICSAHNYRLLRPVIVAAPKSSPRSYSSRVDKYQTSSTKNQQAVSRAVILRDSATVQQAIALPNSEYPNTNESVSIVYISSRANEFMSTISLQLTPSTNSIEKISEDLKLIHVKIIIEGNLFEQLFEPQANLSFVYAWNRRNVYRQKSFGLSTASVSVGYEYYDCKHIIWTTKHIQLPGHDLSISDIGNQWNINIHHRFNYRDSILQRGDGQNFNLKTDKPRIVQPVMGDGYQRQQICSFCDGATSPTEQKLLRPQALISGPDGSLYVGDANLIRRIEPASSGSSSADRVVRTVLELPIARIQSRYELAMNLIDSRLYMSDYDRYQVYLIKDRDLMNETGSQGGDFENLVSVVGTGVKCQINDHTDNCGDGQQARLARLVEPKALAFDLGGRMYIADGPNIRVVDADQKIHTILGDYGISRHTKFPCTGEAMPMHKFMPKAPISLAFNPIDDTLHILDDDVVYKVTQDRRVQVVAGRLPHCLPPNSGENTKRGSRSFKATEVYLQSAQSIAFNQNGDLFISEDDTKQAISRVLLVSPEDDTISLYAGLPVEVSKAIGHSTHLVGATFSAETSDEHQADKQRSSNVLPNNQPTRATEHKFSSISAIALDQQGNLIVADRVQLRVVSIEPDIPQINSAGEYEIQSPDNVDELLVFNRFGHHVATRDIGSSQTQRGTNKYTFSYNVNTSFGQLASVSYSNGNKISIYRDGPHHSVKMIETAFGGQCKLDVSRNGHVHSIATLGPNGTKTSFSYHIDGGLLKQSRDQAIGEVFDFVYDEFGRAIGIQYASPKIPAPVECRVQSAGSYSRMSSSYIGQQCASLIVAE